MEKINRRDFLKAAGLGAVAVGAAACKGGNNTETTGPLQPKGEMEYRVHPVSGDKVSLLGYGTMRWPMIKDENGRDVIDQSAVDEMVDYAIAHGVNYFDSSPVYLQGQSEAATAKALSRYPRESYFLATKLSNFSDATFENSKLMYERSLEIFNTDYMDYYLLHNFGDMRTFKARFEDSGILDFLLKEREAGRIRHLGFSFHGNQKGWDELMPYTHEKYHWDFVQIQMNYKDWHHAGRNNTNAEYLYNSLDALEIPIVIMEPLLGGGLASVPAGITADFKTKEPARSVASWAFRFVGSHPRVFCVLSGMTYMDNLVDNCSTFCDFKYLTDEERLWLQDDIATRLSEYPLVDCTSCQYCMPCPYGIDIPGIFQFYNKAVEENTYVISTEQEGYRKLRKAYLTEYNNVIPTVRQADHCTNCNECSPHCPQYIRIPNELRRIDEYIENLKRETL